MIYYTCNVQEYSLECRRQYGFLSESTKLWTVSKRFSDFVLLDSSLGQAGSQLQLNLPKKKMMGNMGNTDIQTTYFTSLFIVDRDFILQRQSELQEFINKVLDQDLLAISIITKRFLDIDNYSINFQGETMSHQFERLITLSLQRWQFSMWPWLCGTTPGLR